MQYEMFSPFNYLLALYSKAIEVSLREFYFRQPYSFLYTVTHFLYFQIKVNSYLP